jgi:hypothetical protein
MGTHQVAYDAERQLVFDTIFEPTRISAFGCHPVRVVPASKRPRELYVAELAAFDVIEVLKFPRNSKRADANAQRTAIAVANARSRPQNLHRLPRRGQPFERAGCACQRKTSSAGASILDCAMKTWTRAILLQITLDGQVSLRPTRRIFIFHRLVPREQEQLHLPASRMMLMDSLPY